MALFEKITCFMVIGLVVGFGGRSKYQLTQQYNYSVTKAAKREKYETVKKMYPRAFIPAQLEHSSCCRFEIMVVERQSLKNCTSAIAIVKAKSWRPNICHQISFSALQTLSHTKRGQILHPGSQLPPSEPSNAPKSQVMVAQNLPSEPLFQIIHPPPRPRGQSLHLGPQLPPSEPPKAPKRHQNHLFSPSAH